MIINLSKSLDKDLKRVIRIQYFVFAMIIVFVFDQYDHHNNGTTVSMRRFVEQFRLKGHEVRVLSTGKEEPYKYNCPEWKGGFGTKWVYNIVSSQGMVFGKTDETVVRKAISGADVVHFIMPFGMSLRTLKIVRELKIPYTSAFHVQPENILYTIHMDKVYGMRDLIYHLYRKMFYKNARFIHCPTEFIASELRRTGYDNDIRVASNGVHSMFIPMKIDRYPEFEGKKVVLSIGRYSREKRHDVAIRACALFKHHDEIVLVLAGKGCMEKAHRELAAKLGVHVVWGMYPPEELVKIINMSDLYVHPADAEIEAIACMEAFTCGIVPIISNHPKSATHMFAIDDRCKFDHGKPEALALKMDYWIDHPDEKDAMSKRYVEYAKMYNIAHSVEIMETMFHDAIDYYQNMYSSDKTN